MTTEKLLNYGFLWPQDMSQTENSFTFWEVQQTLKVAHISQFSPIEGEFQSGTKLKMFVFVKSITGSFQRGSLNDKPINLSLLKDFYPFRV